MIKTYLEMIEIVKSGKEIEVVKGIIGNDLLIHLINLGGNFVVLVKGFNPAIFPSGKTGFYLCNENDINHLFDLIQVNFNQTKLRELKETEKKILPVYAFQSE